MRAVPDPPQSMLPPRYARMRPVRYRVQSWFYGLGFGSRVGSLGRGGSRSKGVAALQPLSSEVGAYKTVQARFWPWLAGKRPYNLSSCCLFARKRMPQWQTLTGARKVDIRLSGKGNSNSHGAGPVYYNHLGDQVDSDQ